MNHYDSMCNEFLYFKNSGICDGEVLPQNQLDSMSSRFDRLPVQIDRLRKKILYELAKAQLTISLQSAEERLKMWSAKYGDKESVDTLLSDLQVPF